MKDPSEVNLQIAAAHGGFDPSKVPDQYWTYLAQKYQAARDPGTLLTAQHYIQATGVGHFMHGWEDGSPSDTVPLDQIAKTSPGMAEMRRIDQFFNQNIQSRIIEKGQYVSPDGLTYTPPKSYAIGKVVGSVMANPASAAGLPQAAKAAVGATVQAGAKAWAGMDALMTAHPAAATLIKEVAKWGALGAIGKAVFSRGGGGAVGGMIE